MKVSIIIVGINQWEECTLPFIKSIEKYEPSVDILVVDNGSEPPYPSPLVWRLGETKCYADAINWGLIRTVSDWYIVANNDVLCEGPFVKHLKKLEPNALYGNQINGNSDCSRYIDGWIYFIPKDVLFKVGLFDDQFKCAGYEDVDYSYRAAQLGLPILKLEMPFRHVRSGTRYSMPNYPEIRKENREYFRSKHGFE